MKVSAQYAQEHFADILSAVDNGEEVEIARPDKPALFLAPRPEHPVSKRPRRDVLYSGQGLVRIPSPEEWSVMDREIEEAMLTSRILPGEIM